MFPHKLLYIYFCYLDERPPHIPNLNQTTLYDKVCQWLATGQWVSPGPPVSSTNKTDCHDIAKILLKEALNTRKPNPMIWITLNR